MGLPFEIHGSGKKKMRKLVKKLRRSSKSKQRNSLVISYEGEEGMEKRAILTRKTHSEMSQFTWC